jgi:hypothetical protein
MESFVAITDGGTSAILEGLSENAIAVIVIADKQIVVAITGWRDESASLIGVNLASRFHNHGIAEVGAFVGCCAFWCNVVVRLRSRCRHIFGGLTNIRFGRALVHA